MFEGIDLQKICNIIILISATIVAIKGIYGFLKKPVDDIHDHVQDAEEQHIEEVLKREVPKLLQQNCDIIMASLDEIKGMTLSQEEKLTQVQNSLDLLNASQLDVLRYNMNKIYYKYRPYKKILSADKKAFIKLYNDYKPMGGNSWIDALYNEVVTWEIVEDISELE